MIGLWCNDSTTLFGGVGTSLNLVRPTIGIGLVENCCCVRLYVNIDNINLVSEQDDHNFRVIMIYIILFVPLIGM